MVPGHPGWAYTAVVDSSEPPVTLMFELETTPPWTLNGMEWLSDLTWSPSSAGLLLSVRIALPGLLVTVIGTRPPSIPVPSCGLQLTTAEFSADPGPPGGRLGSTSWPGAAGAPEPLR